MFEDLDRNTAKRIIHSLLESGQPPKLGAKYLNVATEPTLKRLQFDYLDGILKSYEGRDGAGVCKWVVANYGNGKTQFLRCLQSIAWDLNYATAFVELVDTLVGDFDVIDVLTGLTARCVELLGAAAAGVLLADPDGTLRVIGSSTERIQLLELFQVQNEQGPCLDCFTSGAPVMHADLAAPSLSVKAH